MKNVLRKMSKAGRGFGDKKVSRDWRSGIKKNAPGASRGQKVNRDWRPGSKDGG